MGVDLSGDRALTEASGDRLGFDATARSIASALMRQSVSEGLVVGIEGRWGSGKSSLVNMTMSALRETAGGDAPEIVDFKPWLIGDRESLLLALFTELALAVDAIEESGGDATGRRRRELGEAGKKIVGFAAQLGGVGTIAKWAGSFVPGVGLAGEAFEAIAAAAQGVDGARSLADEKADLRKRLASLSRRIVISVDDVDRLEPSEVVEILRLVRSVADFPNVVYVLCYDPAIVAHSIEVASQIESGRAYIEKIVQIAISVPRPEAFDLRRWFGEELNALPYPADEAEPWRARLMAVIDMEGGRYLATPRHVVRCLDGIRFFWNALQDEVDLGDLVWLHLCKVGNAKLYDWIERYSPEAAAQASGLATVSEDERRAVRKRLDEALAAEGSDFEGAQYRLSEFLPGFARGVSYGDGNDPGVHKHIPREEAAAAARSRRLASPDHYRMYFAVQQPRNAPRAADFEALFAALDASVEETAELLSRWSSERLSTGATKAEAMLGRLAHTSEPAFDAARSRTLLCALADRLDDLAAVRDEGMSDPQAWIESTRILGSLLPRLGDLREETLRLMFSGDALDWLTTVLRSETFAHGRLDGRSGSDKLLEPAELDRVSSLMIERYRGLARSDWAKLRRPVSALFAWAQAGDPEGPKEMVAAQAHEDEDFVGILELLSQRVVSSDQGEYLVLGKSTLSHFMNVEAARARTEALAREPGDPALKPRAEELVQRFRRARD